MESPEWSFFYDLDGNLIQKSHKIKNLVYNYSWSTLGKLIQVDIDENSLPSKSLKFKYDGLNRRIEKQYIDFKTSKNSYLKRFVYDGEDIILELDGENKIKALFVHGEGIDDVLMMIRDENDNELFEDDESYAYTKDHLGSIREIVDHEGRVQQRYSYSAYGETKIAKMNEKDDLIDSPYGFTGRELDLESGDMYYRARYYDSSTGRFLTPDPIRFAAGDTNLYRYTGNNPVNRIDPDGLDWIYVQSTGELYRVDESGARIPGTTFFGYSGAPGYVNQSNAQNLRDLGPIPQGQYTIGSQRNNRTNRGTDLLNSLRLTPSANTDTFGRAGFIIHGSNNPNQQDASEGCPIFGPNARNTIGNSNDNILRVVP
ncbi:RHS repeat-associated core domain-containing protein [Bacteriovorax sp. Seq25_V]|uniref:RHS repeat-associated core domain-containing protein n=1 Tax=Bacteriovorax sp. Seq25_V TaxID=1201288 RepID=UPI000389DFC2|nr:RHS repeat-associated core domain-containing protein [Bacteriovorax sp. Seq25_V]EQC44170.1 RHS repeat-associated core domain protein [Bacteriovorax sp. Seq25_V]